MDGPAVCQRSRQLLSIRSDVINELILKLQRELKVTSIIVTHDMQSAFKVADRIVMLHEGKVIFDGTPTKSAVPARQSSIVLCWEKQASRSWPA